MKKNIIVFIILLSTILLSLTFISNLISVDYKELKTDSGFDSSWDKGGSPSSSKNSNDTHYSYDRDYYDYSDSRNTNSSSYGTGTLSWHYIIGIIIFFVVIVVIIRLIIRMGGGKKEIITLFVFISLIFMTILSWFARDNENFDLDIFKYMIVLDALCIIALIIYILFKKIKKHSKEMKHYDNYGIYSRKNIENSLKMYNIVESDILNEAYNVYVRVQIAWMNDCIDSVSDVLSDEMLNQYGAQLITMRFKNEQNIMNSFEFQGGYIDSFIGSNNYYKFDVVLKVKCKDYLIDKSTKQVLRGNKNKINYYIYKLTFIKSLGRPNNCPNCGSEIPSGGGVYCPSCGSKVIVNNGNMVMTDKKMLYQK